MTIDQSMPLLGGLSTSAFMSRHWQRKPLLVRQALPGFKPLLTRAELFKLAARPDVESRLVVRDAALTAGWRLQRGPLPRRALPPLSQAAWTVLVHGVDLHDDAVSALMQRFRFVPDARLDDLMISFATDGGGVGPHFDSYDVFLIQAQGLRRWRYGRQRQMQLQPDVPLKILTHFEPEFDEVLAPGDMLYLPPGYAHDGVAEGDCMTYSVGFRVPQRGELLREALLRLADAVPDAVGDALYQDPDQPATTHPAQMPAALQRFAQQALTQALEQPSLLQRALGEYLSEPKAEVWFEPGTWPPRWPKAAMLRVDRRTRMLYDDAHLYVNGDSFVVAGADAQVLRDLADLRVMAAAQFKALSRNARLAVQDWVEAGWMQLVSPTGA